LTRFFLLLSSLLLVPPPARAQESAIPLDTFARELDRVIHDVERAGTPASASSVASTLPARWHVETSREAIEVSNQWLTTALADAQKTPGDWPARRAEIVRRAAAMRDEARDLAGAPAADTRPNARKAIANILAREEFHESASERWREQWRARVAEWFYDLWSRFGGSASTSRRVAIVLAWTAAIAALVGLGFWLARSIADRPRGSSLNLGAGGVARPRARELALRALAEARSGNAREAVRLGYNAALVRLEEDGAWKVDDARTPREYLPMLRADDARRALMLDLTRRFEQIWYGNRAVDADDTPRVTAHLETLGCLRPGERAT
jgi:hypothetical protein